MKNAGTLQVTTPTDLEIVMTRVFDAPRRLLFEAWTNPRHVPHWMLGPEGWTMPVCEIDLRPAGRGTLSGAVPTEARWRCTESIERSRRPNASTESWGGDWPDTLNTVILAEDNGTTAMTMKLLYPSKDARDAALTTGMKEGVAASFDRLAEYLGKIAAAA